MNPNQGHTGEHAKTEGQVSGMEFRGVKLSWARKGFVLLLFLAHKVRERAKMEEQASGINFRVGMVKLSGVRQGFCRYCSLPLRSEKAH